MEINIDRGRGEAGLKQWPKRWQSRLEERVGCHRTLNQRHDSRGDGKSESISMQFKSSTKGRSTRGKKKRHFECNCAG